MSDGEEAKRSLDEVLCSGAVLDGEMPDGDTAGLLRVLRYAMLALDVDVAPQVAADVAILAPDLETTAVAWASSSGKLEWQSLAAALDDAAVRLVVPALRGLADVVRLTSMTTHDARNHGTDTLRVISAIRSAAQIVDPGLPGTSTVRADSEHLVIGWGMLAVGVDSDLVDVTDFAHDQAHRHGLASTRHVVQLAEELIMRRYAEIDPASDEDWGGGERDMEGHLVVCPSLDASSAKIKETIRCHEHAIGHALPLCSTSDLVTVRRDLVFEYPYAAEEIDRLLSPLVGRAFVKMPPTILVGRPGVGKTRLVGRLAQLLGISCWRTDATRADGNVFGGTDRRWWSSEPCHVFLAISRARMANPLILVDEVDKTATRNDCGRLWDSLLPFLERETAARYPDPCLQVDLDVSAASFIMTANDISALPAPLLDRCRVINLPEPRASDLEPLLPVLFRDYAADVGLDPRWLGSLTSEEAELLARRWRGGSVRRLRGYVSAVLRGRDRFQPLH